MSAQTKNVDLVCFGELLWDILPKNKVAGGAPFNIVNRATALGLSARVISSVGRDALGIELLKLVRLQGNSTEFIQTHSQLPTSIVNIEIGDGGEPQYDIVYPVAWDDILWSRETADLVKNADTVVYSSLGIRDARSRDVLFQLLKLAKFKVCDVNLRRGHYERETVKRMIREANILRMNEFEILEVAKWESFESSMEYEGLLKELTNKYGFDTVIVTLGERGAMSLRNGKITHQPVFQVDIKDTVGSGDAFLASYIYARQNDWEEKECLQFACAVGAINASKHGGTPQITREEIERLIKTA